MNSPIRLQFLTSAPAAVAPCQPSSLLAIAGYHPSANIPGVTIYHQLHPRNEGTTTFRTPVRRTTVR